MALQSGKLEQFAGDQKKRRAYLSGIVRHQAGRFFRDRPTDRVAKEMLNDWKRTLGNRTPSIKEIDDKAEEIRLSFPPQRRPRIGFHHPLTEVPIDDAPQVPSYDPEPGAGEPGAEELIKEIEGDRAKAKYFTSVWRELGGPPIRKITPAKNKRIARVIAERGGAAAVARRIAAGTETIEELDAFESLFGDEGAQEAADIIIRNPGRADDIVTSARSAAVKLPAYVLT